MAKFSLHSAKH